MLTLGLIADEKAAEEGFLRGKVYRASELLIAMCALDEAESHVGYSPFLSAHKMPVH